MSAASYPAGVIVSPPAVEAAIVDLLAGALRAYLDEVARQLAAPAPAPPRSITTGGTFDHFAEDQLPAVIVAVSGIDAFEQRPAGYLAGWYGCRIGAACSASDEATTRQLAGIYAGAILACLAQSGGLAGVASELAFVTTNLAPAVPVARRSLHEAWIDCRYLVDNAVHRWGAPLRNDDTPAADPLAGTVDVELTRIPVTEEP